MKKSTKANKLICNEFAQIANNYEEASASKGAVQQAIAKKRLRSDIFKMAHEK